MKICGKMQISKLMLTMVLLQGCLVSLGDTSNILLYPYGHCWNSHLINGEKIAKILLEHGHQVTMLISDRYDDYSGFERDEVLYHNDDMNKTYHMKLMKFDAPRNFTPICEYDTIDFMLYTPLQFRFNSFIETAVRFCDGILSNRALLHKLRAKNFDLFLVESLDPCSKILVDYLDINFIPLHTAGLGHWDGNPRLASYVPSAIAPFTPNMNFKQRLGNFIFKFIYAAIPMIMGFDTPFERLKAKYNMNKTLSIADSFNRASVKLINSDFSIDYPTPIEPDSIMVGGFAIEQPRGLDMELEAFMQSSGSHGVIIFSFGTLVKSFDEHWTGIFAGAFARLPQKVIWRYYDSPDTARYTYNFSSNIRLMNWLPQADLLNHKKTRALITHCGLNSAMEAAYYGVPIVGVPLSGDHFHHASKLADYAGMGKQVDIFTLTSDILYKALADVVNNHTYKDNAVKISQRVRDQPMSSADKINYWVDYVIRFNGAPHLRSNAHKLPWYQYVCLDVVAFLMFIIMSVVMTSLVLVLLMVKSVWSKLSHKFMMVKQKVA